MKIRILTENTAYKRGLTAEHGLSLIIEANGRRILFDTGQTDVYVRNAKKLGEDLGNLDAVILSHGHYDHCGGIEYFPAEEYVSAGKNLPPMYIREGAFKDKRHYKENEYAMIGIDWKRGDYKGQIIETGTRYDFGRGFTLLGKIEYETEFEPAPEGFYIVDEKTGMMPDLMEDEQLLVVETDKGLVLFLGCSHMGIINCIKRVKKEFPGKHIYAVLAGMHLRNATQQRLNRTIEELKKEEIDCLIPVHCTGMYPIVRMKQELGDRCILAETGMKIEL